MKKLRVIGIGLLDAGEVDLNIYRSLGLNLLAIGNNSDIKESCGAKERQVIKEILLLKKMKYEKP